MDPRRPGDNRNHFYTLSVLISFFGLVEFVSAQAPIVVDQGTSPWATEDVNSASILGTANEIRNALTGSGDTLFMKVCAIALSTSQSEARMTDRFGSSVFRYHPVEYSVFSTGSGSDQRSVFINGVDGTSWLQEIAESLDDTLVSPDSLDPPDVGDLVDTVDVESEATDATDEINEMITLQVDLTDTQTRVCEDGISWIESLFDVTFPTLGVQNTFSVTWPTWLNSEVTVFDLSIFSVPVGIFRSFLSYTIIITAFFSAIFIIRSAIS